jgi:hypothetical protein
MDDPTVLAAMIAEYTPEERVHHNSVTLDIHVVLRLCNFIVRDDDDTSIARNASCFTRSVKVDVLQQQLSKLEAEFGPRPLAKKITSATRELQCLSAEVETRKLLLKGREGEFRLLIESVKTAEKK